MTDNRDKKPSYLREVLLHPFSTQGGLLALTAGALLSVPFGLGIGALPLLAFGTAEAIAAVFLTSDPRFREKIDKKRRKELREKSRAHMIEELERRVGAEGARSWETYRRMLERVASLEKVAGQRDTQLSERELERLDDASLRYLGLWLAKLVMRERRLAIEEQNVDVKLANLERQLKDKGLGGAERAQLDRARQDFERLLERRDGLKTRETAVDAAMLTMADALEEVYQQIVTNPTGAEVGKHLEEAAERMRLEEGLDHVIEEELGALRAG